MQSQRFSKARPAEPVLASSLVGGEVVDDAVSRILIGKGVREEEGSGKEEWRIRTGIKSVDKALLDGLREGSVVGVSGDLGPEGGVVDFALSLLSTSLLTGTDSLSAIIDTTGNLDIFRLYTLVLNHIRGDRDLRLTLASVPGCEALSSEELAVKVLERVKIMRVFDMVGVMEAVEEIRGNLEGRVKEEVVEAGEQERTDEEVLQKEAVQEEVLLEKVVVKKEARETGVKERVIQDSQESEDEMLLDSEDAEMLFTPILIDDEIPTEEAPPPDLIAGNPTASTELPAPVPPPIEAHPELQPPTQADQAPPNIKYKSILIDNLASLITPLLSKDYVQANTITHALLCSLKTLTKTHNLLTILLNPALPPRSPYPPNANNPTNQPAPKQYENWFNPNREQRPAQPPPPSPSIFSSNANLPSLSGMLPAWLDVHLLVSRVPIGRVDARKLAALRRNKDGSERKEMKGDVGRFNGVKMGCVVEVLKDRWEGRSGGWGTFVGDEKGVSGL